MSKRNRPAEIDRRQWFGLAGGGVVAAALSSTVAACSSKDPDAVPAPADPPGAPAPADPTLVRVLSVPTAVEGNVLPELIKEFEQQTSYRVQLAANPLLYDLARDGKADLLVSHYGHRAAEAFVLEGSGEWPRTIFSNQMALVGPPADPARIRGLDDASEAFRRIAESRSKFVLNELDGVRYLSDILWNAAGRPDRTGWWIEPKASRGGAIKHASALGAYALWGLTPFLRLDGQSPVNLEPLVLADPLLQRMMVSIIVKPSGLRATNTAGATALQTYLLEAATQARIRTIRYPGKHVVTWVPAGRHNRTAMLPKG
jgi:tungstate transport system substrate-binding protein